jgi:ubiquinone/menaquinone biosynthesis C-methylase UbiE
MNHPTTDFDLPYFDVLTQKLGSEQNALLESVVGRNVHWGYWANPSTATMSPDDFASASDNLTRKVLHWANIQPGHKVLDVGCGFGGTIALINESHSHVSLTGLNIDERQLQRARQLVQTKVKPSNTIDFIQGDACDLPFQRETFDTVLAVECIFHFPSRTRFFEHAYRVLKPGGKLVLCDFIARPLGMPLIAALYLANRNAIQSVYGKRNKLGFLKEYAQLARRFGFKTLGIEDITSGTMPTYAALRKYADKVGFDPAQFIRAQAVTEYGSKWGAVRYQVLAFQK